MASSAWDGRPRAARSGVLEVARHAIVDPEELVLVEPLEVEDVGERFPARRRSWNLGRRVLMKKACTPEGVLSGSTSLTSHPSSTAGMSYCVAQTFEVNSS